MTTKIQKWGNSLAVRLPKEITKKLDFREGSQVVIHESGEQVVITPVRQNRGTHGMKDIRKFIIPSRRKKKEDISGKIDQILYGKPD